jgi:hypothetical protein
MTPEATVKKYLTVRPEGARTVRCPLDYYTRKPGGRGGA